MTANEKTIAGIHHVTAITADAQKNIDFYTGILGLRLVKLTVNFDDPGSYHLYYGDSLGHPGTIMTFFAWPGATAGRIGPPQVSVTAFAVPAASLDFWSNRFKELSVQLQPQADRFGQRVLSFTDPDGMRLELIGVDNPKGDPWTRGPVPADHAIRGFHSVTISEEGHDDTAKLLTNVMGFTEIGSEQNRFRYRIGPADGFASTVDLLCVPDARHGTLGAGVVHHIAFRTPSDPDQLVWQKEISHLGLNVSPVMDRTYFHSIYYREPGGVLFEIATDNPGFTADEPADQLGAKLALPPWLEKHRAEIQRAVPPVRLPTIKPK
jgi:glyoxalase family protein